MKIIISLLLLVISSLLWANDGAFFAEGNLLIPINDSLISVSKEILSIKKSENGPVEITVEYTFVNEEDSPREVLVGFEAMPPEGDVDGRPRNGEHPYMSDFTVTLNATPLPYNTALVDDTLYTISSDTIVGKYSAEEIDEHFSSYDFFYVYYFKANFLPGENRLIHTYTFEPSMGIGIYYAVYYRLRPAGRWKGGLIDDFTLHIDMGEFEEFTIEPFFTGSHQWEIDGKIITQPSAQSGMDRFHVYTRGGNLTYRCKNFDASQGDLSILADYPLLRDEIQKIEVFDASTHQLPFPLYKIESDIPSVDERSHKILRNLPFARRGYVFKTDYIQNYYESLPWYVPDSSSVASLEDLSQKEVRWRESIQEAKWSNP